MTAIRCAVPARDTLGETPLWCRRTDSVWWIDIDGPTLRSFHPASGRHRAHPLADGAHLGSLALRRDGGFLLALDRTLHLFHPESGALAPFREVEREPLSNRLNDGRCDPQGRFWVGTMDLGLSRPSGALYSVAPDGTVRRHAEGIVVSNGLALSPDGRTLYFSDTRRFTTFAFDLDPATGALANRRVHVDHTATRDRPDGACVDAEGFLWVAMFAGGRLARYRPDGSLDRLLPLPVTNPTCLCFGGPDLSTLYITTARKFLTSAALEAEPLAGALLACEPGVRGLPEAEFGG